MFIWPKDFVNKIICGDCLNVMKYIPDNSIDLIIIDPPYGVKYQSRGGPRVSKNRKFSIVEETKITFDDMFNPNWILSLFDKLKNNSAMYVFCNFNSFNTISTVCNSKFISKTTLIWDKGNCGMGDLRGDYGNQTELILYLTKNRHILRGSRDRNILKYPRPADAFRLHPTQKPVNLLEYLILKSSDQNALVLDCFAGSGSTAIACINTRRNFIGIEIEEKYCQIAQQRILNEPRN